MHRLFVAIRPPPPIRQQLLGLMGGVRDLRWQTEEQLHLTLRFIGEVGRHQANDLAAALEQLRFEPFQLHLGGIGTFERRRQGALWAGVGPSEPLHALNAKIERACQSAGLEAERRSFHPHITLARWKGRKPGLGPFLEQHAGLSSPPWEVRDFILFESRLGREGAHYEPAESYAAR